MDNLQEAYLSVYQELGEANKGDDHVTSSMYGDAETPTIKAKKRRRQGRDFKGTLHPSDWGTQGEPVRQQTHKDRRGVPTRGSGVREAKEDENLTPLQKIRKRNKEYFRNNPETVQQTTQRRLEHGSVRGVKKDRGATSAFGTMRHVGGPYREEVESDLFDYLLEYLIAEGYADNNENAIAIMANMSEDWKQSIMEADSSAAFEARRQARLRRQRKKEGRTSDGGDFGHDYSKPAAQREAEQAARWKAYLDSVSGQGKPKNNQG